MCSLARGSECWKEGLSFGFCPLSVCLKILEVNYVLIKELAEEPSKLNELCLSMLGRVQSGHLQQQRHLPAWHPLPRGTVPCVDLWGHPRQGGERRGGCSGAGRRERDSENFGWKHRTESELYR